MSINFKQPRYILPLVLLPFLCLFFYVYHSSAAHKVKAATHGAGINGEVGDVSPEVKKRQLEDKLDAYRNTYKDADGNSAVIPIQTDNPATPVTAASGVEKQQKMLDSVNRLMKQRYGARPGHGYQPPGLSEQDKQLAAALNNLSSRQKQKDADRDAPVPKAKDPMETFRLQLAYMDSLRKANDPAYAAAKQKELALAKAAEMKSQEKTFSVAKAGSPPADFNTVMPEKQGDFIKVVVDENITGYAGSRLRLRLLDDISVGPYLVKKDSYLYALISGFSGQRVTLQVKSIVCQEKILPVKLEVYDLDGLPGLYVPESAFRDFTKDLGQNTVQGVTIDDSGTGSAANQFIMSTASKMFESTSSAIAGIVRKDKAKIKYNSYLYLIDTDNSKNK